MWLKDGQGSCLSRTFLYVCMYVIKIWTNFQPSRYGVTCFICHPGFVLSNECTLTVHKVHGPCCKLDDLRQYGERVIHNPWITWLSWVDQVYAVPCSLMNIGRGISLFGDEFLALTVEVFRACMAHYVAMSLDLLGACSRILDREYYTTLWKV